MRLARCGVGIALILIEESPTEGIKLVTHLGNPGLECSLFSPVFDDGSIEVGTEVFCRLNGQS